MNRFKELRLSHGYTQAQVAKWLSISQAAYSKYESGKAEPDIRSLNILCEHYKLSMDELLGRDTNPLDAMIKKIGGVPYEIGKNMLPILGRVAAGIPLEAQQEFIGYTYTNYKPADEYFGLLVEGESMKNIGIRHGSIVIVHKQDYANDGDIVVALVDGQDATVKRFKKLDNAILLMPENPDFQPIVITPDTDFQILGVVKEAKLTF